MSVIVVETGEGLTNSNSYASVAEGTTFHTLNGTLSTWIDQKGSTTIQFYNQPTNGQTVTIGSTVYTFKSTLASSGDVKIGTTLAETVANLTAAINWTGQTGVQYLGSTADPLVSASLTDTTITVQALVGGSSNSSITVSSVLTLPNKVTSGTLAGGADSRELALIQATSYLDQNYKGRWLERRTDLDQALDWPRAFVDDLDGYRIDSNVVPKQVKDACAYVAGLILQGEELLGVVTTDESGIASQSIEVGPIKESITYKGGGKRVSNSYPKVDAMLAPVLGSSNRIYLG